MEAYRNQMIVEPCSRCGPVEPNRSERLSALEYDVACLRLVYTPRSNSTRIIIVGYQLPPHASDHRSTGVPTRLEYRCLQRARQAQPQLCVKSSISLPEFAGKGYGCTT
ncbi:hypothetical protein SCLCIDRAFT_368955 [Scleroderma citrinum Foug A]|uniref:Uncharacterized protein n=1 Tax=Scleroderma citrinum Foug A TaxID=1036808 RepID=A0A0C3E0L1_9AGAM|nr:hypothetical protein SCLCIDRAFT_368955 [Scleroderma citrinum Foug A]